MKKHPFHRYSSRSSLIAVASTWLLVGAQVQAQQTCTEFASGLQSPLSVTQSNKGNLLVSEGGTHTPNSGRISIVGANGDRRTLVGGLPSGLSDVGDPDGPGGLAMRGRTLYVAIGVGDVGVLGTNALGQPVPGSDVPNPKGPSSPIFSSVLAMHFSANVEKTAEPFTLSLADHYALARGRKVTLSNGQGDRLTIELVSDFADYVPFPNPAVANNVQLSNPFGLEVVGNRLYVTDGGRNKVWEVDVPTGVYTELAAFANTPNPLFGTIGPPTSDAVPTGITYADGHLLVALLRGNPFAAGMSSIEQVDLLTGSHSTFIKGLKTAIGVQPRKDRGDTDYLVLQHSSGPAPFFAGPGVVLHFDAPDEAPTLVANCLSRPSSMTFDEKGRKLYVTEFVNGRIVSIPFAR